MLGSRISWVAGLKINLGSGDSLTFAWFILSNDQITFKRKGTLTNIQEHFHFFILGFFLIINLNKEQFSILINKNIFKKIKNR